MAGLGAPELVILFVLLLAIAVPVVVVLLVVKANRQKPRVGPPQQWGLPARSRRPLLRAEVGWPRRPS